MRLITSIAFMVLMCAASPSAHAADSNPSQLMLTIKLSERLSSNAEERTIANPTLVVTTERPFRFHVGGNTPNGAATSVRDCGACGKTKLAVRR